MIGKDGSIMRSLKKHKLNLYKKFLEDPKKTKRRRKLAAAFFPAFTAFLLVTVSVLSLKYTERSLEDRISAMREVLLSEEIQTKAAAVSEYNSGAAVLKKETDRIALFSLISDSYPSIGTSEIETVIACSSADMSITDISFSQDEGEMIFTLRVSNVKNIPEYVRKLKATELFSAVTYSGYSESYDGSYSVTAIMKRSPVYDDTSFYGYINESVKNR